MVCMRFEPDFDPIKKSNAQRNNEKLRLRQRMDNIDIITWNSQNTYLL